MHALSGSGPLDSSGNNYVLILAGGISGTVPGLVWDGTKPSNFANYSIQQVGNSIDLVYSTLAAPVVNSVTLSPATAVDGQNITITVNVTPGSGSIDPNSGVSVNLGAYGLSTINLVLATGNVYTNTFTIPNNIIPGSQTLTATVSDSNSLTGSGIATLTIIAATEVWNGADFINNADWNDGSNWVSTLPPALTGDALVFAGPTGLAPAMEQNYSISSLTFTNGAGSFDIGTTGGSLTITAGGVTNNSANVQTLNVPIILNTAPQTFAAATDDLILDQNIDNGGNLLTVTDGGHNTTIYGNLSDNGGLTKAGIGTLTLGGDDNYNGNTTINGGTVVINGSATLYTTTGKVIVGNAATNAVLNIAGASVFANEAINPATAIGNVSGANGFLFMSSGTFDDGAGEFHIGQAAGAYGAFDFSGGTLTVGDANSVDAYFVVGAGGEGVFNLIGGTINDNAEEFSIANTAGGIGVANLSSGTLNDSLGIHVGDRGTATLNVSGSAVVNLSGGPLQFGLAGNVTVGTVNLVGGTVTANYAGVAGTSTSRLNFNGGTLMAAAGTATFLQGLTAATIYSGGAIIDDGGNTITIAQPLLAPTGNGVSSIPVTTGGAGYLDIPIVTISGGGGVGASAVATVSGGDVTGITILSPGTGYTSAPTVTLFGGGRSTAATLGTATLAANISGGLTKQNTGTVTLSGTETYTGNTTINGGTLEIVLPTIATNSTVTVAGSAVLQLDFTVTNTVTGLVLNGVAQAPGVYNNATSSPYITGYGNLLVTAPATLSGLSWTAAPVLSGKNLTLSATSTGAGTVYLLTSTNLTAPLSTWIPIWTNALTGSGSFTTNLSNAINPGAAQQFYLLSTTNN